MEVINATGRRKTSVARIYMKKCEDGKGGNIIVNKRDFKEYFPLMILQTDILRPFSLTQTLNNFDIKARINGGGFKGQAEALRLAIARALCKYNIEFRPILKSNGLLTRDPRMVERKKPGQKKARKRFQFSKR